MGKSVSQKTDMPVILLSTAVEEDLSEKEGVIIVPWPCETKVLVERIETALSVRRHLPYPLPNSGGNENSRSRHAPVTTAENTMQLIGGKGPSEEPRLPPGYGLDRSDTDVLVLLCPQGTTVARFSVRGVTAEAIEREAKTHYRERNRSA